MHPMWPLTSWWKPLTPVRRAKLSTCTTRKTASTWKYLSSEVLPPAFRPARLRHRLDRAGDFPAGYGHDELRPDDLGIQAHRLSHCAVADGLFLCHPDADHQPARRGAGRPLQSQIHDDDQ